MRWQRLVVVGGIAALVVVAVEAVMGWQRLALVGGISALVVVALEAWVVAEIFREER